jgi:hypothetical protein
MRVNAMSNTVAISLRALPWAFAIAIALAALQPASAAACSCMQQSQEDAAQNATAIFEGRVSRIEDPTGEPKVHFKIVRSFKGPSQEALVVSTPNNSAACGYGFEEGQSYLVYASEQNAVLSTSLCSRTQPIASATEDLSKLGLGVTPFDPGPGSDQPTPTTTPTTSEPAKGGCASCTVGARHDRRDHNASHEQRALTALGLLVLGLLVSSRLYRITSRRRSGSRS